MLEIAPNYAKEHNLKNQHKFWKCQCICGNIVYIDSGRLGSGKCISCGCKRKNKQDLTNQVFGRLTVINENKEETENHKLSDRRIYWNCKCNFCGTMCIRSSHTLLSNKNRNDICCDNCHTIKNIIGEKHGKLTITAFKGKNDKHNALWECTCECGNKKIMTSTLFNLVYSCGCLKQSIGELHIAQLLDEHNIKYIYNSIYFNDLISIKQSKLCRYDFIILDENNIPIRLIEFDGIQHTNPSVDWYTVETIANDKIKNQYALEHNIPLIRIPYQLRDTVTYEDLMSNTYLITKEEGELQNESNIYREDTK